MDEDGRLKVRVYFTDTPGKIDFTFSETNGVRMVAGKVATMRGCSFSGKEIQ